jgi:hypothetical protein
MISLRLFLEEEHAPGLYMEIVQQTNGVTQSGN